jgi:hypothetical protein
MRPEPGAQGFDQAAVGHYRVHRTAIVVVRPFDQNSAHSTRSSVRTVLVVVMLDAAGNDIYL